MERDFTMRPGGGKHKGAAFEREICSKLSLWITHGKRTDTLWRSAMSGGRATVAKAKGIDVRQCGDICPVAEEAYEFCSKWFIECKHVRHLALDHMIVKGTGPLAKFWEKAVTEAKRYGRDPMIIARQNGWPTIVITKTNHLIYFTSSIATAGLKSSFDVTLFDEWMATRFKKFKEELKLCPRYHEKKTKT